jgi:hypothetical protein
MRVYCSNHLKEVPAALEPFFLCNRTVTHIHTSDGMLQVDNNKIYRFKAPPPVKKTMIGVFPATLKSEPYERTECYQIPPHSTQEVFIHKVYKLSPKSVVEYIFVMKQLGGELIENYFSVPEGMDINRADVKGEILGGLRPL